MAGLLASYGYHVTTDLGQRTECELWVLNSCTVKGPSEESFFNAVEEAQNLDKFVVMAGCVPEGDAKNPRILAAVERGPAVSVVGVNNIDRIVEVVEETLQGNSVTLLGGFSKRNPKQPSLDLPKIRKNKFIEIIPINQGCLNQCTYCKTKHSRGDLRSYSPEEIVARVRKVIQEGVSEIWLSSEDTGTYGRDIGESLPSLLQQIVDVLPLDGSVMLRVGMTNPPYILEHLEAVCRIMRDPRVYEFLHVPVQSGSDRVLRAMRREYSRKQFMHVVETLRKYVPDITLATDVICGFPTETSEDFQETLGLISKYKFPVVHISQFYPRRGTPAARMKRIPSKEVKDRSRVLTQLFNSYKTLDHKVGLVVPVICTDIAADGFHYVAHNKSYDQVLVKPDPELMGKRFMVKIISASKFSLSGEVIPDLKPVASIVPQLEFNQEDALTEPLVVQVRMKEEAVEPSLKLETGLLVTGFALLLLSLCISFYIG